MSATSGKEFTDNLLSAPSHFTAARKPKLIPPSIFTNPSQKNFTIKTPSDFSLKQNNESTHAEAYVNKEKSESPNRLHNNYNIPEKLKSPNRLQDNHIIPAKIQETRQKTLSNSIVKPPPGFPLHGQSIKRQLNIPDSNMDLMASATCNSNEFVDQCFNNFDSFPNVKDTVSKQEYKKLENMYNDSRSKLDVLEMRFAETMKSSQVDKDNNHEKLMKQIEAFKFQNEFLCEKLKKLEQEHGVNDAVNRYLSQNQFESEKVAFNNHILKLERNLFEKSKENEDLSKSIEAKDQRYEKAMLRNNEERYSYKECIVKLNARISDIMDENEKLRGEKEDALMKLEDSLKNAGGTSMIIKEKDKYIDDLSVRYDNELNNSADLNRKIDVQKETYESALVNVEKMLKEEVVCNSNSQNEIKDYKNKVRLLENKLDEMNAFLKDLQSDNEQIKVLKNHMDMKCEEIIQLQGTCRSLQSTNETLNIRINSLSEMLDLQEPYKKGFLKGDKEKLLQMWREKVYSLLVLLKSKEMKLKNTESYDGSSTL